MVLHVLDTVDVEADLLVARPTVGEAVQHGGRLAPLTLEHLRVVAHLLDEDVAQMQPGTVLAVTDSSSWDSMKSPSSVNR